MAVLLQQDIKYAPRLPSLKITDYQGAISAFFKASLLEQISLADRTVMDKNDFFVLVLNTHFNHCM